MNSCVNQPLLLTVIYKIFHQIIYIKHIFIYLIKLQLNLMLVGICNYQLNTPIRDMFILTN